SNGENDRVDMPVALNGEALSRFHGLAGRSQRASESLPAMAVCAQRGLGMIVAHCSVRASALTPFHIICTPMHTRRNDDRRRIMLIALSPRTAARRSAKP